MRIANSIFDFTLSVRALPRMYIVTACKMAAIITALSSGIFLLLGQLLLSTATAVSAAAIWGVQHLISNQCAEERRKELLSKVRLESQKTQEIMNSLPTINRQLVQASTHTTPQTAEKAAALALEKVEIVNSLTAAIETRGDLAEAFNNKIDTITQTIKSWVLQLDVASGKYSGALRRNLLLAIEQIDKANEATTLEIIEQLLGVQVPPESLEEETGGSSLHAGIAEFKEGDI